MERRSCSAPPFQMSSGMRPAEEAVAERLPPDAALRLDFVLDQSPAQKFEQGGVFLLLEHDLIQQLLGEDLLLLGGQGQHVGEAMDYHAGRLAGRPGDTNRNR